jgi:hypothetical protein
VLVKTDVVVFNFRIRFSIATGHLLRKNGAGTDNRMPWSRIYLPYWAVGVPVSLVLIEASPLGANFIYVIAGIPLLLLLWAVAACGSLFLFIQFAARRSWKSSIAYAILPAVAFFACLNPDNFVRGYIYVGDLLHFAVARPYYDSIVAELPDDQPRIAVFNWGGMVWASRGVVYDETDEVDRPAGQQSVVWRSSPRLAELGCGGFRARRLWSHYYLVNFPC